MAKITPEQEAANKAALERMAPITGEALAADIREAVPGVPAIYGALNDILHALAETGIAKKKAAGQGDGGGLKYAFRGIDQVLQALSVLLAKHRVMIIPRGVSSELRQEIANGKAVQRAILSMSYVAISAVDGSQVILGPFYGEGSDYSDKATNKAQSNCYKYMAFQTFCIPVEGGMVDVEDDNIESAPVNRTSAHEQFEQPEAAKREAPKSAHQARKDGDYEWLSTAMALQRTESELTQWAQSEGFKKHHAVLPPHWKTEFKEDYRKHLTMLREAAAKRLAEQDLDEEYDARTGELKGRPEPRTDRRSMDRTLDGDQIPFDDPIQFPGDLPHSYSQAKGR